jgi:uncharacterized RDD family membrane protein YckC
METTYQINQTQANLLDDLGLNIVQASTGQRFANFLIDIFSFYGVMITIGVLYQPFLVFIVTPVVSSIALGLYMSLVELIFKGKTLGKLITGTRAVQEDGTPITASQAFGRGFSRIVPFEAFSALGNPSYPWHDRWSHTYVINVRESTLPE